MPLLTCKNSGKFVVVNLQPTKHDKKCHLKIETYVDEVMVGLVKRLGLTLVDWSKPLVKLKSTHTEKKEKNPFIIVDKDLLLADTVNKSTNQSGNHSTVVDSRIDKKGHIKDEVKVFDDDVKMENSVQKDIKTEVDASVHIDCDIKEEKDNCDHKTGTDGGDAKEASSDEHHSNIKENPTVGIPVTGVISDEPHSDIDDIPTDCIPAKEVVSDKDHSDIEVNCTNGVSEMKQPFDKHDSGIGNITTDSVTVTEDRSDNHQSDIVDNHTEGVTVTEVLSGKQHCDISKANNDSCDDIIPNKMPKLDL